MDMAELKAWLNAVITAQVEFGDVNPLVADECWGFFSDWREELKDAAWEMMGMEQMES